MAVSSETEEKRNRNLAPRKQCDETPTDVNHPARVSPREALDNHLPRSGLLEQGVAADVLPV
jgi:hypothetical protein